MPWWGWITIGAMLLVAELTIVDLEFYLVLLGVSALAVGGIGLAGIELAYWVQWALFAVLSLCSLVLFRQRIYRWLRPAPDAEIPQGVVGEEATPVESIAPGATGPVQLRGTTWTARNLETTPIPAGTVCRVERADGLVLEIRRRV
ncbi:MAG: NfeD family protein [Myxococcales bacterium]|nr:NfeD family protein [Myxococcales bacterium]